MTTIPDGRLRRRGAALALLATVAALGAPACRAPEKDTAPRVLLIGLDGLDPLLLERHAAEGRVPHLARLMREGAWGPLRSREPLLSPLLWTTIATGRRPQDHGVLDFVEAGPDGKAVPISSTRRKLPALWNVASEFDVPSGFVGWYASWPAETTKGFLVSDRLGFHQVKSARAEAGATWPEGLAAELRERFGEPRADLDATRRVFLRDPGATLTPDGQKRLGELAKLHATSELYRRALPYLQARFRTRLLGVYFEIVDACGHLFMEDAPPRRPGIADADFLAFSETVDRCYAYQDEVTGDLLKVAGPETVTMVLSDHGFKSGEQRPRTSGRADTGLAPLWHRLHGVLLVHGKGVRPGTRIEGAGLLDITPTVLALLRVPPSRETTGQPLAQAFEPGTLPTTLRPVTAYAPPPPRTAPQEAAADPEAIERLHALGYIGAPGTELPHDAEARTPASWLNEGSARAADGDEEGALRAWSKSLELDPKNVSALAFSGRARLARGNLERARALLDRAFAVNPQSAMVRLQRASLALKEGDLAAARDELRAAEALDDNIPGLHLAKARLASAFGAPEAALAALAQAEGLTDSPGLLAEITLFRASLLDGLGRADESRAALEAAAKHAPAARIAAARGELALERQDWAEAARWLGEAARQEPGNATVERQLGQALAGARDDAAAEAAFRRAIAAAKTDEDLEGAYGDLALLLQGRGRDPAPLLEDATRKAPRSARLWGLLGAAHGRAGREDAAIRAYERSVSLSPTPLACNTLAALLVASGGDRDRATALWRQSLALDPDQPDVRRFLRTHGG